MSCNLWIPLMYSVDTLGTISSTITDGSTVWKFDFLHNATQASLLLPVKTIRLFMHLFCNVIIHMWRQKGLIHIRLCVLMIVIKRDCYLLDRDSFYFLFVKILYLYVQFIVVYFWLEAFFLLYHKICVTLLNLQERIIYGWQIYVQKLIQFFRVKKKKIIK